MREWSRKRLIADSIGMAIIVLICGAMVLCGCHEPNPACSPGTSQAIDVWEINQFMVHCQGYTRETCPAWPSIRAEGDARRESYVQCRR